MTPVTPTPTPAPRRTKDQIAADEALKLAEKQQALRDLAQIQDRHLKRGQKLIAEAVADGEDVMRVYELCKKARTSASAWLKEHWGMSDRAATNYVTLFRHREILPKAIKPTVAVKLLAPHVKKEVMQSVFDLAAQGVEITNAMVDKLIHDDTLTESISLVASYLLERDGKPKEIVNELTALKAEIDARRGENLAFDDTFKDAVKQRAIEQKAERDNVVYVALRVVGGRLQPVEPLALVEGSLVQAQLTLGAARAA